MPTSGSPWHSAMMRPAASMLSSGDMPAGAGASIGGSGDGAWPSGGVRSRADPLAAGEPAAGAPACALLAGAGAPALPDPGAVGGPSATAPALALALAPGGAAGSTLSLEQPPARTSRASKPRQVPAREEGFRRPYIMCSPGAIQRDALAIARSGALHADIATEATAARFGFAGLKVKTAAVRAVTKPCTKPRQIMMASGESVAGGEQGCQLPAGRRSRAGAEPGASRRTGVVTLHGVAAASAET
jgi:hypothetical protein